MARYIDADKLCEALKSMASVQYPDKQSTILGVVSSIENFPTADVVPKREVEMLQRHNELTMEMAKKALANAKVEVAQEIFEELARKSTYVFPTMLFTIAKRDVDELKKKYIGGNDNG